MTQETMANVPKTERLYIQVGAEFDATGYMQPRTITWSDGRVFPVETVIERRAMETTMAGEQCERYTVTILGNQRYLYFQHSNPRFNSYAGRWFVHKKDA